MLIVCVRCSFISLLLANDFNGLEKILVGMALFWAIVVSGSDARGIGFARLLLFSSLFGVGYVRLLLC